MAGLTWAAADGVKSDKKTPAATEKNAITAGENDHCQRPSAECPKEAKCPKEMHAAKSGQCCRKHSGSDAKSAQGHGTTVTPEGKPVDAVKAKEPAAK